MDNHFSNLQPSLTQGSFVPEYHDNIDTLCQMYLGSMSPFGDQNVDTLHHTNMNHSKGKDYEQETHSLINNSGSSLLNYSQVHKSSFQDFNHSLGPDYSQLSYQDFQEEQQGSTGWAQQEIQDVDDQTTFYGSDVTWKLTPSEQENGDDLYPLGGTTGSLQGYLLHDGACSSLQGHPLQVPNSYSSREDSSPFQDGGYNTYHHNPDPRANLGSSRPPLQQRQNISSNLLKIYGVNDFLTTTEVKDEFSCYLPQESRPTLQEPSLWVPYPGSSLPNEEQVEAEEAAAEELEENDDHLVPVEEEPGSVHSEQLPQSKDVILKRIQSKKKNRDRQPKVWEFLMRLLANPTTNPSLIKWENEETATFRLADPQKIVQLWTSRNDNTADLTYNNFTRSIRYHYKAGTLVAVSERHHMYRCGPKALAFVTGLLQNRS